MFKNTDYWGFVFSRMMVGMSTAGIFVITYVLAMEMIGPDYRHIAGAISQFFGIVGYFGMTLIAYSLNYDWRLMQVYIFKLFIIV